MKKIPVLSLCIPTWNRASFLKESLQRLESQLKNINLLDIEIFISDNCSSDDTELIVSKYISHGMPINYNKNEENIGMDGNFITCVQYSHGHFIWVMGDDDYLVDGALLRIIDLLKHNPSIGLLHLREMAGKSGYAEYGNIDVYLKKLTYWSTFITGNIFNRDALEFVSTPEKYIGTYFILTPFYLTAALTHKTNIVCYDKIFEGGADAGSNGGYNYFEVFVRNYLEIWREYTTLYNLPKSVYRYIKRDIYRKFHLHFIHMLLILKKNVLTDNKPRNGRKGFYVEDGWKILKHYYGREWYAIPYFVCWELKNSLRIVKRKLF